MMVIVTGLLTACDGRSLNNPYPARDDDRNILYSEFSERPKHLDPVRSYSANEYVFLAQIYEPVVQYHYLKRISEYDINFGLKNTFWFFIVVRLSVNAI